MVLQTIGKRQAETCWRRYASTGIDKKSKIVALLYPDPASGYSGIKYARDSVPDVHFQSGVLHPGKLLGSVSGALGLREWLEDLGHEFIVTSSDADFEKEMEDADVVISQPFWPAYVTRQRIDRASRLKMCITAGIGSDHVDLEAACERKITVAEVTGSNVVSVAEHVVMMILGLVRNYIPSYKNVVDGGWDIAECISRSYDVEGMKVGTVAAGRIGLRVLQRLKPFDVELHYFDKFRLPKHIEEELDLVYHDSVESLTRECDVVTINCPLHPETEHLFDEKMLKNMKRGSYIVNTARGKIVDTEALVSALESGHIAGYAGDVWFPQPAPSAHPWRTMPFHAMTPHISGTSLSAQCRYAAGVKEILEAYFESKSFRPEYLIAHKGELVTRSYTSGNTTGGSEAAATI